MCSLGYILERKIYNNIHEYISVGTARNIDKLLTKEETDALVSLRDTCLYDAVGYNMANSRYTFYKFIQRELGIVEPSRETLIGLLNSQNSRSRTVLIRYLEYSLSNNKKYSKTAKIYHQTISSLFIPNRRLVNSRIVRIGLKGHPYEEDLVQEGNIGLLKATKCFQRGRGAEFSTFAGILIKNEIMSALDRYNKYYSFDDSSLVDELSDSTDEPCFDDDTVKRVNEIVNMLPELEREVIFLRYYQGLNLAEIEKKFCRDKKVIRPRKIIRLENSAMERLRIPPLRDMLESLVA